MDAFAYQVQKPSDFGLVVVEYNYMIWILIAFVVIAAEFNGLFTGYGAPDHWASWIAVILIFTLLSAITLLVFTGIGYGIGQTFTSHPVKGDIKTLTTIRDKDGVTGQFFLGSGTIESRPYYFYYIQMEDGALQPGKIEATSGVRIYEEDRQDAELVTFNWVNEYPWWAVLICIRDADSSGHSYDFHVPKGSVKKGFSL